MNESKTNIRRVVCNRRVRRDLRAHIQTMRDTKFPDGVKMDDIYTNVRKLMRKNKIGGCRLY